MAFWSDNTFKQSVRLAIYFAFVYMFVFFMHFIADIHKDSTFSEGCIIENIQLSLLSASGIILYIEGRLYTGYRQLLFFLSSLCFLACFRELDYYFDKQIFGWQIAFVLPLIATIFALQNFSLSLKQVQSFVFSSSFHMMLCAVILILPVAQCIGHRPFVVDVLGSDDVRDIKEFIEESCKTIGYFLIFLSIFEVYWGLLRPSRRK